MASSSTKTTSETRTDTDDRRRRTDVTHQGTPLAGLLLLIAVAAVAAAIVGSGLGGVTFDDRYRPPPGPWGTATTLTPPSGLRWVSRDRVIASTVVACVLCTGIGTLVGLWHPPRVQRTLAGGLVGSVVGGVTGLLIFCPPRFGVILGGAAAILGAALFYEWASRDRR